MSISVNPTADLINARLAFEQATQNGQVDAAKKAAAALSPKDQIKKMGEFADTFNKQNGTSLPITPKTLRGKAIDFGDKISNFLKTNKKALGIGAAAVAGLTAVGLIAKKVIDNKKQEQ